MARRLGHVSPILVVVLFIGLELLLTVVGIVALALLGRDVPEVLATVCVGAMTGLTGLLAPNTGLMTGSKSAHNAHVAGSAAAAAVLEADELRQLSKVADELAAELDKERTEQHHQERKHP